MCLTGWRNCDETMGLMEPQAVLGKVELKVMSCIQKEMSS